MTFHCSLIGGYNILEEYSPGLNFTLSSVKKDEAGSYFAPVKDCVLGTNLIDINQIFVCNVNQMMRSEVDTWFTGSEGNNLGSFSSWLQPNTHTRTHAHTHTHTHIYTYIHSYSQFNYVTFFNFIPPDKENNM